MLCACFVLYCVILWVGRVSRVSDVHVLYNYDMLAYMLHVAKQSKTSIPTNIVLNYFLYVPCACIVVYHNTCVFINARSYTSKFTLNYSRQKFPPSFNEADGATTRRGSAPTVASSLYKIFSDLNVWHSPSVQNVLGYSNSWWTVENWSTHSLLPDILLCVLRRFWFVFNQPVVRKPLARLKLYVVFRVRKINPWVDPMFRKVGGAYELLLLLLWWFERMGVEFRGTQWLLAEPHNPRDDTFTWS